MEIFKNVIILLFCVLKLMGINEWKMYWNLWKLISNKEKKEKNLLVLFNVVIG